MKTLAPALLLVLAACGSDATMNGAVALTQRTPVLGTFTSDPASFETHSFWFDTGREVVVFDAQFTPKVAEELIAEIHARTASPIRWVVVSHPNPDKFNGASAFQAIGAKVVASESTTQAIPAVHAYKKAYFVEVAKAFTAETYPAEARIDVTFRGDWDLPLEGGAKVKLHELANRGVSSTQTVASIPQLDALIVGDLVHHEAHAWLEGGLVDGKPSPDLEAWKRALDELLVYPGTTVHGGRGTAAKVDVAVADEKAYLDRMNDIVGAYAKEYGADAGAHYPELARRARAAFPTYAAPYLIEYGAYGLVLKLQGR